MNMDKLTAFVKKHGIKAALVGGGGVLLATNYGSCEITPAAPIEEEVPAEMDDAAPEEGEAGAEE
tara:strand:- start:745 stop:939 length:195 start_codon:yes stop_codon:yes gene_type:complete